MNYTEPKVIYTCFPGGKHKVLTMSYDDGLSLIHISEPTRRS